MTTAIPSAGSERRTQERSNLWDLAAAMLASIAQLDYACSLGMRPMHGGGSVDVTLKTLKP